MDCRERLFAALPLDVRKSSAFPSSYQDLCGYAADLHLIALWSVSSGSYRQRLDAIRWRFPFTDRAQQTTTWLRVSHALLVNGSSPEPPRQRTSS